MRRTCNSCYSSSRFLINMTHQLHLTNTFKERDPVEWIAGGKARRTFALEDNGDLLSTWACLQKGWQRRQGFLRKRGGGAQNGQPQAVWDVHPSQLKRSDTAQEISSSGIMCDIAAPSRDSPYLNVSLYNWRLGKADWCVEKWPFQRNWPVCLWHFGGEGRGQ